MINISERMKHNHIAGLSLIAIEKSKISMSDHFGVLEAGSHRKINEHTIFNACSISKFLTSILVLKLVEQGFLNLDADIDKKITSWKVPDNQLTKRKKVTLRNLLCHQSGIMDLEGSFTVVESVNKLPSMVEILDGKTPYCKTPIEVMYEPESEFHYSDAGFCVIQLLIEDTMCKPFPILMEELIFQPLGMTNSIFPNNLTLSTIGNLACGHHLTGTLISGKYAIYPYPAACGLWTSASDLAILLQEVLNAVKGRSKIGLSVTNIKELFQPQGCLEWSGLGVFLDGQEEMLEFSSLGWGVGFQCMLVAYPYLEKGLIIMTNTDTGKHQMKGIIGEIYQSFMK